MSVTNTASTLKERFIGTWILTSLTVGEGPAQTMPYGRNPAGSMMVDGNGRFMITVFRSDLPTFASGSRIDGTPAENEAIVHGTIAYYGSYAIDEATGVMTVRIEACSFPNFSGHTQTRILSFAGDVMSYINPTPSNAGGAANVTWRRAS